ncbi:MAG: Brp/Blh family beta-carotene 15,15'-dioxygenase [Saprospiraceae bacterium]|nr:Brp/Blh family beta-carotene 15,15'-dioxygenase [Saprospiraceae bacterium]
MLKISLLLSGCILILFHHYLFTVGTDIQFVIFLCGILLLGVPHGAADLLVATQTAGHSKKHFSKFRFLAVYISRLLLFAFTLWLFPVIGTFLFIFFAAYHFGETDLYQFKTHTWLGKLFVIAYGLLILAVMLLHHFEDVKSFLQMFQAGRENMVLLNWLDIHRYIIISVSGMLFFTTTFIYFLKNNTTGVKDTGAFLVRLAIILFILFNLPMLLGFTFYFVVWHSVLSLNNILIYLHKDKTYDIKSIGKQIGLYSLLAIGGICAYGLTSFMLISSNAVVGYLILGLAVLTAPHMQIMHDMYNNFRQIKAAEN